MVGLKLKSKLYGIKFNIKLKVCFLFFWDQKGSDILTNGTLFNRYSNNLGTIHFV